jgi:hypothetical protein
MHTLSSTTYANELNGILLQVVEVLDESVIEWVGASLENTLLPCILQLTDDQLKNEDKRTLNEVINIVYQALIYVEKRKTLAEAIVISGTVPQTEIADSRSAEQRKHEFELQFARKCFFCPFLEKRLAGLNDIREKVSELEMSTHPLLNPPWAQPMYVTVNDPLLHVCSS